VLRETSINSKYRILASVFTVVVVSFLISFIIFHAFQPVRILSIPNIYETTEFPVGGFVFDYLFSDAKETGTVTTIIGWAFAGTETRNSEKYLVFLGENEEKHYFPITVDRIERWDLANHFGDIKALYGGFEAKLLLGNLLVDGTYRLGVVINSRGTYFELIKPYEFIVRDGILSFITSPQILDKDYLPVNEMREYPFDFIIYSHVFPDFNSYFEVSIYSEHTPNFFIINNSDGNQIIYDISPFFSDGLSRFTINAAGLPRGPTLDISIVFSSEEHEISRLPEALRTDNISWLEIVQNED